MKSIIIKIVLFGVLVIHAHAQAIPVLEDQLNSLWRQKNYEEIGVLLDGKTALANPDVAALYCAKFFYLFVKPDNAKALSLANKLKVLAQATGNESFLDFANDELEKVQGLIEEEDTALPVTELLIMFHKSSPDKFPEIEMGIRLRKYTAP
jgi:hypothetical protein